PEFKKAVHAGDYDRAAEIAGQMAVAGGVAIGGAHAALHRAPAALPAEFFDKEEQPISGTPPAAEEAPTTLPAEFFDKQAGPEEPPPTPPHSSPEPALAEAPETPQAPPVEEKAAEPEKQ